VAAAALATRVSFSSAPKDKIKSRPSPKTKVQKAIQGRPRVFKLAQQFDRRSQSEACSWPKFWANPVNLTFDESAKLAQ
jgi:hypothetical protein